MRIMRICRIPSSDVTGVPARRLLLSPARVLMSLVSSCLAFNRADVS